jgi:hypothetical protein
VERTAARRPALVGFVVGFLLPVPAAFAALLLPAAERVAPWLTPGRLLLRPFSGMFERAPGALTMLLASLANGLVVAGAAAGAVVLLHRRQP